MIRPGMRALLIGGAVLIVMLAASLGMYYPTRTAENAARLSGDATIPDRIDVTAWVTHIDTTNGTVSVSISSLEPHGSFADESGMFRNDVHLNASTSLSAPSVSVKRGEVAPDIDERFGLTGVVTDYPFDRYTATLDIRILDSAGNEVPTAITLFSTDPFFAMSDSDDDTGLINLTFTRSTPTMVYAVFVMVLMLGLAIAAATAAYYILHGRRGLLFPACSMMAAMLFALVPLRNAVPGNPPIGSVIDFGSFFIAEIVISVSLIASVIIGHHFERANERSKST